MHNNDDDARQSIMDAAYAASKLLSEKDTINGIFQEARAMSFTGTWFRKDEAGKMLRLSDVRHGTRRQYQEESCLYRVSGFVPDTN
jgi:hypothetical protein